MFSTYFINNKTAYNLKGFDIASPGGKVADIKVNPAGYSFALISGKPGKRQVTVHPVNSQKEVKNVVRGVADPTAISYTPDSRSLVVADGNTLKFFNSKTLELECLLPLSTASSDIAVSSNGYFIAATMPGKVEIINAATGEVRTALPFSGNASVSFSPSSSQIAVLSDEGKLDIYSTADFSHTHAIEGTGRSTSVFFHPDENYIGMVTEGTRIQFVNLFDPADRPTVYDSGLISARFLRDGFDNLYVASSAPSAIKYRRVAGFDQNYGVILSQMLEDRMREWMKMRPGETDLEYRERVNEESIRQQRQSFANEIASELALTAGLGTFGNITLGRYNPADGTLIVSLGNGLNDICLKVPPEDMPGFGDGNNLQFSNHVFSVTPANSFELIYVQVYNPTNLKTYVFDNLDGQSMDFLLSDDGFVSLDLILQSSREDVMLKTMKDLIMEEARSAKILSEHTDINVETYIESATDASGRQIKNYHVDFTYKVDETGSATEDFPPGKYRIQDSHAAESMLKVIRQAFGGEFAKYIVPGKELIINITGTADAKAIRGSLAYDGAFGEYADEPCYIDGNLTTISVNADEGIRSNEQLAFMRAHAVQDDIERNLTAIKDMNVKFRHNMEVSKQEGAQFRRIDVSLVFIDALF